MLGDQLDLPRVHDFGDDRKPRFCSDLGQHLEGRFAEALKGVGRAPRLIRPAAQKPGARGTDGNGGFAEHVDSLDGAGAGDDRQRPSTDVRLDRVPNLDHRRGGRKLPRGQLVRFEHGGRGLDPGE